MDLKEISKRIVADCNETLLTWKDSVCPLILGCYDQGEAEEELKYIRDDCRKRGFTNAILLKDVPDPNKKKPYGWGEKYKKVIKDLTNQGFFVMLIFVIHPVINKGAGQGLIVEVLETIHLYPALRSHSVVIKHKNATFIETINYFHSKQIKETTKINESLIWLKEHLNGYEGFIKHELLTAEAKLINTSKIALKKREVIK